MSAKVITANRLPDGMVVYLDRAGGWSEWIDDARIARTKDESDGLQALAERADQGTRVLGPYLMDVIVDGGRLRPASNREIIRAQGPTVRTDLGKQLVRLKVGDRFIFERGGKELEPCIVHWAY